MMSRALLLVLLPVAVCLTSLGGEPSARAPVPRPQEEDDKDEFEKARELLYAQDFEAAAKIFRGIVERNPEHPSAWFFLAYTVHVLGDWEEALELHIRAATFEERRSAALYNAGCACALLGRTDEAFEWLEKAFAAGFDNRELVGSDSDLDSLRDDPRLDRYLPERKRRGPLFVDNVRVLYTFDGKSPGDQFGWEGRNAGDCDGDGTNDILISAPYVWSEGSNAGRVYVYSGATGDLHFFRTGAPGENLGMGIAGAGDVDADGHADIIAGATNAAGRPGVAYVFSGRDGEVLLELSAGEADDTFGWDVAGIGDFDDDGHADVAVGAPGSDRAKRDAGRVYVYSGKEGALLVTIDGRAAGDAMGGTVAGNVTDEQKLIAVGAGNAGPGRRGRVSVLEYRLGRVRRAFEIDAGESGENLGRMFLSFVGDVDGDGFPDVYASDWEDNARGRATGRAYVHSGKTGERIMMLTGEHAGDGFGIGTGCAGDVDRDGRADLIIGAWRNADGAPSAGKCYVYSGADGSLLTEYVCQAPGDTFGFDAVGMGDLDGDGGADFLVTSAWSGVNGKRSGRAFVIAGPVPETVAAAQEDR